MSCIKNIFYLWFWPHRNNWFWVDPCSSTISQSPLQMSSERRKQETARMSAVKGEMQTRKQNVYMPKSWAEQYLENITANKCRERELNVRLHIRNYPNQRTRTRNGKMEWQWTDAEPVGLMMNPAGGWSECLRETLTKLWRNTYWQF